MTDRACAVTDRSVRSPHRPIGHRTGRSVTAQARSVTAQARSVTAQSDRSQHRLDRSPHRLDRSPHRLDRSPHRLDRSPHRPIGHRTDSIGHRTGPGNRKFYFGKFLIDGNMSKAYLKPDFEKRVYVYTSGPPYIYVNGSPAFLYFLI